MIFGQGNPGSDYTNTRHNVGWLVIDTLAKIHSVSFTDKPKFHAAIAEIHLAGEKILLVKPATFYNETGKSARSIIDFYKLDPIDCMTLHDDVALPIGTIRTRSTGSDAGNNGIKSLNAHLGPNHWRMRIGIRPDHAINDMSGYVLGRMTQKEVDTVGQLLPDIISELQRFAEGTIKPHSISVEAPTA